MVDYKVDQNFKLVRSDFNCFEEVRGKEEFQQSLIYELTEREQEIIGKNSRDNSIISKINLIIQRVAKSFDQINSINNISVFRNKDGTGSFTVAIRYDTGDKFEGVI